MNQEQVIEWAREAGLIFNEELGTEASKKLHRSRVERFAALVAAHEREMCAQVCWDYGLIEAECSEAADVAYLLHKSINDRGNKEGV